MKTENKPDNKLVKDYKGNLIKKSGARKISGQYYEEGISCFYMSDEQWYRISSNKITLNHSTGQYVFIDDSSLTNGIVGPNMETGYFTSNDFCVVLYENIRKGSNTIALNEDIAKVNGFLESVSNGYFYKEDQITNKDREEWFDVKNIPNHERSPDYNLEANKDKKKALENSYKNLNVKISKEAKVIGNILGDLTFGFECEVINGFLSKRIRYKYGIKALKDGSLRDPVTGKEGLEYVSIPMSGPKGVQVMIEVFNELNKRCEVNELCSLHFHFGNVRKDKLYVLSMYKLMSMLQNEMFHYFPYCRFNSIKPDGKVYCKLLENKNINYKSIINSKDEESFKSNTYQQFDKIYSWLNNGHHLGETYAEKSRIVETVIKEGKKMFCEKWFSNIYTTKSTYHSQENNQKWDKVSRYYIVNFLNLFFSKIGTIEFRCEAGTVNKQKTINWFITCICILRYSEDINKVFSLDKITLKDVLSEYLTEDNVEYLMSYYNHRKNIFFIGGGYRPEIRKIDQKWFKDDNQFNFDKKGKLI